MILTTMRKRVGWFLYLLSILYILVMCFNKFRPIIYHSLQSWINNSNHSFEIYIYSIFNFNVYFDIYSWASIAIEANLYN